ncbi:Salicylate carboxymethyltransferase [Linum perenne]
MERVDMELHMNGGSGDMSYPLNSILQHKVISMTKATREEAITKWICSSSFPSKTLAIADLGCASGPNALFTISELIKGFVRISRNLGRKFPQEFQVFMNDLPGNDFNNIFSSIQEFMEQTIRNLQLYTRIHGVPGSFYGRLFPEGSLHLVHSSYSLHWLSQVPDGILNQNRGSISYGSSSPPGVFNSYLGQFQKDFSTFLRCRALKLVSGGKMVLAFPGRRNNELSRCCYILELMSIALHQMASEGLIDMERLSSLNVPVYMASPMEVEAQVKKQGSFTIDCLQVKEMSWDPYQGEANLPETLKDSGFNVAKCMRAVLEPLLVRHLDLSMQIIEEAFRKYALIVSERIVTDQTNYANVIVSLTKKHL